MSAEHTAATALAAAFLVPGPWEPTGLVERAAVTMGGRRRWLAPLARTVLDLYRDPPADRPRELAAVIQAAEPFVAAARAARRRGHPLRVRTRLVAPTRMAPARWPVARLDDLGSLADLLGTDTGHLAWWADTDRRQRRAREGPLHLYRYRWLDRPGRVPRLLEIPAPTAAHRAAHLPGRGARAHPRPPRRRTASCPAAAP